MDQSITTKLVLASLVFVLIIGILTTLTLGLVEVSQGVRAYVYGEGLWSKAQRDAVYYLSRYAQTQDERDFQRYRQAVDITLDYRSARLEMDKPVYDYDVVERGFVPAGNHPDDVPHVVFLYRHFGDFSYLAEAISLWRETDVHIDELIGISDRLRAHVVGGRLSPEQQENYLAQIDSVNAVLTPLARRFSETIAEGARTIPRLMMTLFVMATMLLLGVAIWISFRIARHLQKGILNLKAGAEKVAAGDLTVSVEVPSRDELGDLAVAFNDMILHRREAANTLSAERQFLEAVLDNISDGVVACDQDGVLSVFNRATRSLHGLPAKPLPPDAWAEHYDLYLADGRTRMTKEQVPLFRAYSGEVIRNEEMVIAPGNLPLRHILVNGQPIRHVSGERLGAVCTLHDFTDRKHAEQELQARASELERSNAELRRFAYVASHDLQAPLRTIASFSQMLASRFRGRLDESADEYIGYITRAASSMSEMLHGLLAYSRTSLEQQFVLVSMEDLVKIALDNLRTDIAETGAEVRYDSLPELRVIPQQMVQVFQNLIQNSLKFRAESPPQIGITASRQGSYWSFTVADNGIGISPDNCNKIFDIFQRLHTDEEYSGSGIGLSLCKQIVEHHGGEIFAEPGNPGTVIRFTLPAAAEELK